MKKRLLVLSTAVVFGIGLPSAGCGAANGVVTPPSVDPPVATRYSGNPILTQRYAADPEPMIFEGRLYVYSSNDMDNRGDYHIVSYNLISTDDMVNWLDHGVVFRVPRDAPWAGRAFAPAAVARHGKVFLYFPNGGSNIGVAVADRPEGPFVDPLGRPLVDRNIPNANVAWVFDPGVFIDDDGQAYLYFGGGANAQFGHGQNLRVIRLNTDMISVTGPAITIEARNSFEAAFVHKRNDTYYFTYSTDFSEGAARIDYLTSSNPVTGWTYRGVVLENPRLNGQNINRHNNNHQGIIEYGDNWYIFYHDRRLSNEVYFRNISVERLVHNEDGTIRPVVVTAEGVPQIRYLDPFRTVKSPTINQQAGIAVEPSSEGGTMVTSINDGNWIRVAGVDFANGARSFEARVASGSSGGRIELRAGSATGPLIGTVTVPATGGWNGWETVRTDVSPIRGVHDVYFMFKGEGAEPLFNFDSWKFNP
jgi:arabinoxylan arabinofuranohydrolase